ncbi:hlyD family secretion protein [Clostridium sp. CAG:1013]|nr:hlyD family secretion protein [Clostridium sp. CAG:1013]
MNSKKIRTVGALLLALLVLLYVGYQAYQATHQSIKTETAMYGEASEVLQAQGFVIRDETVINESVDGVLSYRVADGARVSANGVIADVFATESDAAARREIELLDGEIENLEALSKPADYFVANPSMLGEQIYSAVGEVVNGVNQNEFSQLSTWKENLLTALARRQLIVGEESAEDYAQRISELQSERDALASQAGYAINTIQAPEAGYFISTVDGLEGSVDVEDVEDLTVSQVEELLGKEPSESSSAVGKICGEFNWYVACVLSENDMVRLEDVTKVSLDIPFASSEKIPAEVIAKNYDSETGKTAVIFQCSYMDSDIASVRNEAIEITVATYSGVLVNERALRFEDVEYTTTDEDGNTVTKVQENVRGVYVLFGGQLEFVQVFTEHSINGYAICKTELSSEEQAMLVTNSTIQLYDQVVVEGTDLYDGKIVQ